MIDFAVIGAQKAGSTFVHACLSEHPSIWMPPDEILAFEDPDYHEGAMEDLVERLRSAPPNRTVGIKRPDYLAHPEVPRRLAEHAPRTKLIVILRNPVDRLVSSYFHLMKCGFIPIRPLDEGVRAILDGQYAEKYPKSREIVEWGFYCRHLASYREFFPMDRMWVATDEALREDPAGQVSRLFRFLGVAEDRRPNALKRRANPGVYSLPRIRFINLRNRWVYDFRPDRTKRYYRGGPAAAAVNAAVVGIDRGVLKHVFPSRRPPLAPDLRERLSQAYASDVRDLRSMLGETVPASWGTCEK